MARKVKVGLVQTSCPPIPTGPGRVKAIMESMEAKTITMAHFEKALGETRASVTPEMEKEYENIAGSLKAQAFKA